MKGSKGYKIIGGGADQGLGMELKIIKTTSRTNSFRIGVCFENGVYSLIEASISLNWGIAINPIR